MIIYKKLVAKFDGTDGTWRHVYKCFSIFPNKIEYIEEGNYFEIGDTVKPKGYTITGVVSYVYPHSFVDVIWDCNGTNWKDNPASKELKNDLILSEPRKYESSCMAFTH
jgi:hypothetical protein